MLGLESAWLTSRCGMLMMRALVLGSAYPHDHGRMGMVVYNGLVGLGLKCSSL